MRFVKYGDDVTSTEGAGVAETHGTRIQKQSFPNLGQDIAYSKGISLAFLTSSKQILGLPRSGHYRLLQNPSQIIILTTTYYNR